MLYGLPGSGKSHFARVVAKRCGAVVLDSDIHRRAIIEGSPRYDGPENQRLFAALNRRAEELLDGGQVVVFDSSGLREWIRRPLENIAAERGITPVRAHLDPSPDVIFARLRRRRPAPEPSNGAETWLDVYHWMEPGWQPVMEPHLRLTDPEQVLIDVETVRRLLSGGTAKPA